MSNSESSGCLGPILYTAAILAFEYGGGEYVEHHYSVDDAIHYLDQQGYSNERLLDTDTAFVGFQGCDQTDAVKHEFMATAPDGSDIRVMVCNGLFKGATTRQGGV